MSKLLFVFALTLITGLLSLSVGDAANAQDCERTIPGNTQSPCKQLDYLDGIQHPTFVVEQFTDEKGEYGCQGFLEFTSATPLQDHSEVRVAGSDTYAAVVTNSGGDSWHLTYIDSKGYRNRYTIGYNWQSTGRVSALGGDKVRSTIGPVTYLWSRVGESPFVFPYLVVAARIGRYGEAVNYIVVSDTFARPQEVADYQLLVNQCLAGITQQLEHDAALETARKQATEDKVKAETAAEEAKNQAELAAIELASAEAALQATEELNAALLQETILSIKREDVIRAAWQQVILVRMAGLEARTAIWNEAVTRWAEEDLQFSSAMEARIQEVERLQALNAALEQSMADQRRILIARLEELEKAEQEALATREPTN